MWWGWRGSYGGMSVRITSWVGRHIRLGKLPDLTQQEEGQCHRPATRFQIAKN